MNTVNLALFQSIYAIELDKAVRKYPEKYVWPKEEFPLVLRRMFNAIEAGTFNKDGHAFKNTCKELGIQHTYKAIREYLGVK